MNFAEGAKDSQDYHPNNFWNVLPGTRVAWGAGGSEGVWSYLALICRRPRRMSPNKYQHKIVERDMGLVIFGWRGGVIGGTVVSLTAAQSNYEKMFAEGSSSHHLHFVCYLGMSNENHKLWWDGAQCYPIRNFAQSATSFNLLFWEIMRDFNAKKHTQRFSSLLR